MCISPAGQVPVTRSTPLSLLSPPSRRLLLHIRLRRRLFTPPNVPSCLLISAFFYCYSTVAPEMGHGTHRHDVGGGNWLARWLYALCFDICNISLCLYCRVRVASGTRGMYYRVIACRRYSQRGSCFVHRLVIILFEVTLVCYIPYLCAMWWPDHHCKGHPLKFLSAPVP